MTTLRLDEIAANFYVLYLRSLEANIAGIRAVEEELAVKRRALEGRMRFLKDRVVAYMAGRGTEELRGDIYRFRMQRNGGRAPLVLAPGASPDDSHPEELVAVQRTFNTDRLRQALEDPADPLHRHAVRIASLGDRGRSLRIY